MSFVSKINVYLNENEPWKVLKEDKERAGTVLTVSLTAIISAANVLSPYMPTTSKKVLDAIPREHGNIWEISKAIPGEKIKQIGHLFKKFD